MSLEVGSRIAHYDVTALIGEGGMGQVYQATDTNLDRQVAIKVLPGAFASDPDRLARFEREAKVLASLNHPNIGAIYGLEKSGDTRALVLELIEGPTLADRIAQGPIPVDEALPIAKQIAEALEAAHEQGVIHRDLKPANIKVRDDGTVKVLDFGSAKALDTTPEGDPSQSPTLTAAATQMGVIMGTAAYMSPEQARGKQVDKRSDIWAFGVVLYEILVGVRPFTGDDVSQTIAQVIERAPDLVALPESTPPPIRRLLRRCFEKEPSERLRDIGDARLEIREARATADADGSRPVEVPRTRREVLAWSVAGVLFLVLIALALFDNSGGQQGATAYRTSILLPDEVVVAPPNPAARFSLSPDGTQLAVAAMHTDGRRRLWVRSLDATVPRVLEGTEGAYYPIWSPDSQFLAFQGAGSTGVALKRVAAAGGPVVTICETPGLTGGSWNRDDVLIFSSVGTPIQRVSASGGTPTAVTATSAAGAGTTHREAFFLPDGQRFLYLAEGVDGEGGAVLFVGAIDADGPPIRLLDGVSNAQYARGNLFFVRDRVLMAQAFDAERLQLTGPAVPLADEIDTLGTAAAFSASDTGALAYQAGSSAYQSELAWFDRAGERTGTLGDPGQYVGLRLSPDDRQVAVTDRNPRDIWVFDLDRGFPSRFTFTSTGNDYPVWSPDGSRMVFSEGSARDLFVLQTGGGEAAVRLLADADGVGKKSLDWSRDGEFLIYAAQADSGSDLRVVRVAQGAESLLFVETNNPLHWTGAEFSPSGRWVVFESGQSGRSEVYVAPFPDPTGRIQVSTAGGVQPKWQADGSEIIYLQPDADDMLTVASGTLMAATVSEEDAGFQVDRIQPLFRLEEVRPGTFDVTSDGQRVLAVLPAGEASYSPITLVTNWPVSLIR